MNVALSRTIDRGWNFQHFGLRPHLIVEPVGAPLYLKAKGTAIAEIAVLKTVQKLETSNAGKVGRHLSNANDRNRVDKLQSWNLDLDRINAELTRISAAKLCKAHQLPGSRQTICFFKKELKGRLVISCPGVGNQKSRFTSFRTWQYDFDTGPILIERPEHSGHQLAPQIVCSVLKSEIVSTT